MLAAVGSDAYNIVKVLHILCAIIGFGSVFLASFYYQQARARRGSEGIAIIESYRLVGKIATYFMVAVLLLGVAMVLMSDDAYSFGDTWILLSLVLSASMMSLATARCAPRARNASAAAPCMQTPNLAAVAAS